MTHTFFKRTFPFASLVLLGAGLAKAQTTQPAGLTVAVLDFSGSIPGSPQLGAEVGEALTALLGNESLFTLVDRSSLARTLQEHELSLTGLTKPEDTVRVGHLVGAKILVSGKAFVLDDTLFVTAKVIGTETSLVEGVLVKGKAAGGVADLLPQLAEKIGEKIRTAGPKLTATTQPLDPLPGLKAKLAGRLLPHVSVNVTEEHHGEARRPIDPAVDTEIRVILQEVGFVVVGGATTRPMKTDPDVVVSGEAFSEFAGRVGNLVSCSARAEMNLTDRVTGKVLLSARVTCRAADLSENIAGKAALQKAGRELGVRLVRYYAERGPTTQP